jgi:hypothetical protein
MGMDVSGRKPTTHAGFHPCIPGRCIDHDALPTHDVHALADHDVSGQRNRLCLRIVDAQITAGILILGTAAGRQGGEQWLPLSY